MREIKTKKELDSLMEEKDIKCFRYYKDYYYYGNSIHKEEYKISRFNKEPKEITYAVHVEKDNLKDMLMF